MEALVERDQAGTRFSFVLIAVFAAIAVMLAGVGLYGVLSTVVRPRTAEIGLRMALGAAPSEIFKVVLGHGLLLSELGVTAGLLVAWGVTRIIASILVGVSATDPFTFVAMTGPFGLLATPLSTRPQLVPPLGSSSSSPL